MQQSKQPQKLGQALPQSQPSSPSSRLGPTGRAVALEFQGRTVVLYVKNTRLARFRVMLGAFFFRLGQRLLGVQVGKGRVVVKPGTTFSL